MVNIWLELQRCTSHVNLCDTEKTFSHLKHLFFSSLCDNAGFIFAPNSDHLFFLPESFVKGVAARSQMPVSGKLPLFTLKVHSNSLVRVSARVVIQCAAHKEKTCFDRLKTSRLLVLTPKLQLKLNIDIIFFVCCFKKGDVNISSRNNLAMQASPQLKQ